MHYPKAQISFTVDEDAVSLGGQPALSVVDLGHGADIVRVQEVLDGLAGRGRRSRRTDQPQLAAFPDELILKGEPHQVAQLRTRIQSSTPDGWRRRFDLEQRLQQMRAGRRDILFFKTIRGHPGFGSHGLAPNAWLFRASRLERRAIGPGEGTRVLGVQPSFD